MVGHVCCSCTCPHCIYLGGFYYKQDHFLHTTLDGGWLAADNWLRGAGTSVMHDRGNCGKVKVARGRKGCTNTWRK